MKNYLCLNENFQQVNDPDCADFIYIYNLQGKEDLEQNFGFENINIKQMYAFDSSDDEFHNINKIIKKVKKDVDFESYNEEQLDFYLTGKQTLLQLITEKR